MQFLPKVVCTTQVKRLRSTGLSLEVDILFATLTPLEQRV